MAIALMTVTAQAQGMGKGHKGEPKKEDQAKNKENEEKKKALENAYKTRLKVYPHQTKNSTLGKAHANEVDFSESRVDGTMARTFWR